MNPEFRSHYFDDSESRAAFKTFLQEIHGLDLSRWENAGYWDENFHPFSFFQDGQVIASTCLYVLPMLVQGGAQEVAQVSSVGTHPDYRRRGLNRELHRRARKFADERALAFTYLFADENAVPFYQTCGFKAAPQSRFRCPAVPPSRPRAGIALDVNAPSDRQLIEELTARRTPVSSHLGHQSFGLQMFHTLYTLSENLTYLPDLDLIVASRLRDQTLLVLDLIGSELPSFSDLAPYLTAPEATTYEFAFEPDRFAIDLRVESGREDDGTHVDEAFPFSNVPFCFPFTAHA